MARVTQKHIRWRDPISVTFGFMGITTPEASTLVRSRLKDQFPELDKPHQCVYVVRLKGSVAVDYGDDFSPVIYIGEGNAATRLYNHARWIAELLVAVPRIQIEIRVADCVRVNDTKLCRYVEADLIAMFIDKYKCLPWFNKQRESSCEKQRLYTDTVLQEFRQRVGKVQGSKYIWAISPTSNNDQYKSYDSGWYGCGT